MISHLVRGLERCPRVHEGLRHPFEAPVGCEVQRCLPNLRQ